MARATTLTFIAGWFGFLAITAMIGGWAVLSVAELAAAPFGFFEAEIQRATIAIESGGNAAVLAVMLETLGVTMAAALLAVSGWIIWRGPETNRAAGERLAFAGFAAIGLIYVFARVVDSPVLSTAGTPTGFGFVLLASVLAILMDRLIMIEEPEDDEEDFRAALTLIGQQMARDAVMRGETPNPRREQP